MAPAAARPRSDTTTSATSNKRPKSRASTTSTQSATTQPSQYYPQASEPSFQVQPQPQASTFHRTPEEMIAQSQHQLMHPDNTYRLDPSLQSGNTIAQPYKPEHSIEETHPTQSRPPMNTYYSFDGKEHHGFEVPSEDQLHESGPTDGAKRKKGSATSQANDMELRKLFRENDGRPLREVAAQVLENDRGPKSEKTKQIFAMLWLASHCKRTGGSVPRNRVFSHYATRCGTERVPPLNPASFGKLVRIIFPGIQTRRLGVRGESKYHYVELSLDDDRSIVVDLPQMHPIVADGASHVPVAARQADIHSQRPQLPPDTALFPSPGSPLTDTLSGALHRSAMATGGLYLGQTANSLNCLPAKADMVSRVLKFPTSDEPIQPANELMELPSIDFYLPNGVDADAVQSLTSVYRSHCNLAIENFRFCKRKDFWLSYQSLLGLLTVPGQKLLAHPSIAHWIKKCDWLKYQKMMYVVQTLVLAKNTPRVIRHIENVMSELCPYIALTFQGQPQHVQDAMIGPATIFINLLERMLTVNNTAQGAAFALEDDIAREQMWSEWVTFVKPLKIVQETLPMCGYGRVFHILSQEIRELLSPVLSSHNIAVGTMFDPIRYNPSLASQTHLHSYLDHDATENYLDRWVTFLQNLPARFPELDARLMLNFIDVVGNAAIRDLSQGRAQSLNAWWRVKMFLDEMTHWLAEKGGFLEEGPETMTMRGEARPSDSMMGYNDDFDDASETYGGSRPRTAASTGMSGPSRYGSVDIRPEMHRGNSHIRHLDTDRRNHSSTPHSTIVVAQSSNQSSDTNQHTESGNGGLKSPKDESNQGDKVAMSNAHNHDDSGIGLGLEDEEFGVGKYSGFVQDGVHGSDPADVVVC